MHAYTCIKSINIFYKLYVHKNTNTADNIGTKCIDSLGHDEYNKVGLSTPLWQAMASSESALALTTQTFFASEASEVPLKIRSSVSFMLCREALLMWIGPNFVSNQWKKIPRESLRGQHWP